MLELIRTIASLGAVVGALVAIFVFFRTQKQRREEDIYERVGSEWLDLLRFAAEHSDLDPMNTSVILKRTSISPEENGRIVLNSMFATIAGRSWLAYRKQSKDAREKRWTGWDTYITNWIKRSDFREFWTHYGNEYDTDFAEYIDGLLEAHAAADDVIEGSAQG